MAIDPLLILENEITRCRLCPRLVAWREQVAETRRRAYRSQAYWGRPVPGFGDADARILIIGLAPGAHGSNRTGRMFTGDASGEFLYPALYQAGFASQPTALELGDGLRLRDAWITAVCRCAPPDNKPTPQEIHNCRAYLLREAAELRRVQGIVALGKLAYDQTVRNLITPENGQSAPDFGHNVLWVPEGGKPWLLASYHPSRQNTQTGRLTPALFAAIWQRCRELLENPPQTA